MTSRSWSASHGTAQVREIKDSVQFARADVPGQADGVGDPDLADQHPALVLVGHGAPGAVDLVHVVAIGVGVVRAGLRLWRDLGQFSVLCQQGRRVDPDTVGATIEPEPEHGLELGTYLRVSPVEVGLLGSEQVEVPLARRAIRLGNPGPRRSAEDRLPAVGRQLSVRAATRPEPEPAAFRRPRPCGQRCLKPRVLIRAVIGHDIDDDPDPDRMRLGDQRIGVGERAEGRLDVAVVGDVVAGI